MKRKGASPVAQWIIDECDDRGISWAEASRRAGVDKATISLIVRGTRPGVETCRALAKAFDVPVAKVLELAGHLDDSPPEPVLSAAIRRMAKELEQLPEDVQKPLLKAWQAMLDATRVAAEAAGADAEAGAGDPAQDEEPEENYDHLAAA